MSRRRAQGSPSADALPSRITSVSDPRLQNSVMMQAGNVTSPMNCTMFGCLSDASTEASCSMQAGEGSLENLACSRSALLVKL